ncbi:MAG: hypothetical protein JSS53_08710 [Proteobacteria bacterium]|nr:hypothetical protein [Pseudomonadota bacterium]
MKRTSLEEGVWSSIESDFIMPEEVTYQKMSSREGITLYVFFHEKLGKLGRLVVCQNTDGEIESSSEIFGEPSDRQTLKRGEILEPIIQEMLRKMEVVNHVSSSIPQHYSVSNKKYSIKTKVVSCERCKDAVAMLVFMPDTFEIESLEDYAQIMHSEAKELKMPTWIVGAERAAVLNGDEVIEAPILKVWPTREKTRVMPSIEFNLKLKSLTQGHCV